MRFLLLQMSLMSSVVPTLDLQCDVGDRELRGHAFLHFIQHAVVHVLIDNNGVSTNGIQTRRQRPNMQIMNLG